MRKNALFGIFLDKLHVLINSSFVVYGFVGIVVTLLKLLVLFFLRDIVGLNSAISVTLSYIVAVISHFFLNKHITFKLKDTNIVNTITLRYILAQIVAFIFYSFNIYLFNSIFNISFYISVYIALFLSFIFNYFMYKKFVFGH